MSSERNEESIVLSDGESNPGLPRFVEWQAEIITVRPSKKMLYIPQRDNWNQELEPRTETKN
jgi:hypothetical protein